MERNGRLREIFIRYVNNQCTPEELEELMEYFREGDDAGLHRLVTEQLGEPADPGLEDDPRAVDAFINAYMGLRSAMKREEEGQRQKQRQVRLWPKVAAAAAITLMLAFSWVYREALTGWIFPVTVQQAVTQTGERKQIALMDGTTVWLSPESTLEFPERFRRDREVSLTGEAFFEVAPDTERPFIIRTGDVSTMVLGTSFNVEAYDDGDIAVTVLSGSVAVGVPEEGGQPGTGPAVTLAPNERAVFRKETKSLSKEPAPEAADLLAQREGIYRYRDTPIHKVIRDLQRQYHATIRLEGTAGQGVYGTLYANEDITVFLEKLSISINAKWQQVGAREFIIRME